MKAVLTAIVGAGVVIAVTGLALPKVLKGQTLAPPPSMVQGPSERVEFSSVLTRTTASTLQTGRFFRAADGSERHETGPAVDVVAQVEIKNVAQEKAYYYGYNGPGKGNGWTAHPMQLAGFGVPPFPKAEPVSEFTPDPKGQLQHEGFAAVERTQGGVMQRLVPALNFLIADQLDPAGNRLTHSHIQVGSLAQLVAQLPPVQSGPGRDPLFEPPAGATVTWNPTPSGMIITRVKPE
jgi:hypothetical protein